MPAFISCLGECVVAHENRSVGVDGRTTREGGNACATSSLPFERGGLPDEYSSAQVGAVDASRALTVDWNGEVVVGIGSNVSRLQKRRCYSLNVWCC